MKKKVLLGMSGGLDSSVSALLLLQQGYDVLGATMRLRPEQFDPMHAQQKDIEDAAAVCSVLGIPHIELDFIEPFTREVLNYFTDEYFCGRTPNPCIACNRNLKFGLLLDYALAHGCDAIATGHYADIRYDSTLGRWLLRKTPSRKDQSYVLYHLTQRQLSHTLFPMLSLEKAEARALAEQYRLPVAQKPDSQDICFIPDGNYAVFLERYTGRKAKTGPFVDEQGNILGEHRGVTHYTIGQRKGLGAAFGKPMYVTRINSVDNTVTLGEEGSQYASTLIADDVNFIPFDKLTHSLSAMVKARYQAPPAPAVLHPLENGSIRVQFETPQRSVTPGQAAVFYQNDLVLGGGTIR